ncbi:CheY chemotaxis protein or a CheY-like REC (receiver) domain [Belliella buryatensis]|uniref:CheY chemotaxis protein or a CheY-like REC (Receiver) domain n=1 Tax=Belliella buryatensis TaxID=1500549 RepID=A0A239GMX2_9BACT|nr:response regulator [Belliella buryatensis]SNS70098.1 CheY chemotaxis protein or a CheY-like REC (receiver) domain [Belliella buryatensis]
MEAIDILLVEDNSSDAELSLRAIKKYDQDLAVLHLEDGEKVLDFIKNSKEQSVINSLKLIILDLKIPKINGIEVLNHFKESSRFKNIPIVMLTSSMEEKDIEAAFNKGVSSYLVKPMIYEEYIKMIHEMLQYWIDYYHNSK